MKKHLILSVIAGLGLSACSVSREEPTNTFRISASAIANSPGSPSEKAEEYAKSAELLATAQGLEQADKFCDLALQQDPKNMRAGFLKVVLAPIVLQKGIYARIQPLYRKDADTQERYRSSRDSYIANEPNPAFAKFVTTGTGDIFTEEQLQTHLDLLMKSFENLRTFLNKNKDNELTMKSTVFLVPDIAQRYANACVIKTSKEMEFELVCPSALNRFDVSLNRGDFEFLQDMAAMYEMFFAIGNSYSMAGMIADPSFQKLDPQQAYEKLLSHADFGKLRDQQTITRIKSFALDFENGFRWAMGQQSTLCPKGQSDLQNRVGNWLNSGFCINVYFTPYLDIVKNSMSGIPQDNITDRKGSTYKTKMEVLGFLDHPMKDLRSLGPVQIDKCKQILNVGDRTLGGIFPLGDANTVLVNGAADCNL